MGRVSLEKERTQQLLKAFIECIPEHGLEGTSLEQVAEKAGMKRNMIRHYIGNRDALIDKLIDYVIETTLEVFHQTLATPGLNRMERLFKALFEPRDFEVGDKLILYELVHSKERFPQIQKKIGNLIEQILEQITQEIRLEYPGMDKEKAQKNAYTLVCISFSQDSMVWLGISPTLTRFGPEMANQIIATLAAEEK